MSYHHLSKSAYVAVHNLQHAQQDYKSLRKSGDFRQKRAKQTLDEARYICLSVGRTLFREFRNFIVNNPELYGNWVPGVEGQEIVLHNMDIAPQKDAFRIFYTLRDRTTQEESTSRCLLIPREFLRAPRLFKEKRTKQLADSAKASLLSTPEEYLQAISRTQAELHLLIEQYARSLLR